MRLIGLLVLLAASPPGTNLDFDSLLSGVANTLVTPPAKVTKSESGGVHIKHTVCVSRLPPDVLADYFTKKFAEAGLYFPNELRKIKVEAGHVVSALDTENLVSHTIFLQPNGKATTIVLTEGDMSRLQLSKTSEAIAPLYPGAKDVATAHMEGTALMSYSVEATPAQIKTFYSEEFPKQGYAQQGDESVFVKGNERAHVNIRPGMTRRHVVVSLTTLPSVR